MLCQFPDMGTKVRIPVSQCTNVAHPLRWFGQNGLKNVPVALFQPSRGIALHLLRAIGCTLGQDIILVFGTSLFRCNGVLT